MGILSLIGQNEKYIVGQEVCFKTFDTNTWIKGIYKESNVLFEGSRHPHKLTVSTGEWICWDDRIEECCEKCEGSTAPPVKVGESNDEKTEGMKQDGIYFSGIEIPEDLNKVRNEMLARANQYRQDPNYRKNMKSAAATDLSGDMALPWPPPKWKDLEIGKTKYSKIYKKKNGSIPNLIRDSELEKSSSVSSRI